MRWLLKGFTTIGIIVAALFTLMVIGLHTPYAARGVNRLALWAGQGDIEIGQIEYSITSPWQLLLTSVSTAQFSADQLELWVAPASLWKKQLILDGLKIDNPVVSAAPSSFTPLKVRKLAIEAPTLNIKGVTLNRVAIEVENWSFDTEQHHIDGEVKLSAKQWQFEQWQGDDLYIDSTYHASLWRVHALTTHLFDGQLTLQGDLQSGTGAYIELLHLNNMKVFDAAAFQQLITLPQQLDIPSIDVQQFDINNSHLALPHWQVQNFNMSLQRWQWPNNQYEQDDAYLSVTADTIQHKALLIEEPLLELHFTPQQIRLPIASMQLLEGRALVKGAMTPDSVLLDQLRLSGVEWQQTAFSVGPFIPWLEQKKYFTVAELQIGQTQLTQLTPDWPVQILGLNIKGQDLVLRHQGVSGLWQGSLTLTAARANLNHVLTVQPSVKMHSIGGQWQISELLLPFEHGLLEGGGEVNLSLPTRPWQGHLNADSVPTTILSRWLALPITIEGASDFTLQLSGLAKEATLAQYSLTGELNAHFRQLRLDPAQQFALLAQPETAAVSQQTWYPANANDLNIVGQRGIFTVSPWRISSEQFSAQMQGKWDIPKPQNSTLTLQAAFKQDTLEKALSD
ncbi:AsmA family protein [Thaumasiovibrio sp. DFM-14]|uniref:AsmA family protein n=1 Tax=Thaumasiovibrio sp. DFM-14 TaxID=3384792 RepID=UPI0039A2BB67